MFWIVFFSNQAGSSQPYHHCIMWPSVRLKTDLPVLDLFWWDWLWWVDVWCWRLDISYTFTTSSTLRMKYLTSGYNYTDELLSNLASHSHSFNFSFMNCFYSFIFSFNNLHFYCVLVLYFTAREYTEQILPRHVNCCSVSQLVFPSFKRIFWLQHEKSQHKHDRV